MKTIGAFFWGAMALAIALILEVLFSVFGGSGYASGQTDSGSKTILVLAIIEELSKILVLYKASAGRKLNFWPVIFFAAAFGMIEAGLSVERNGLAVLAGILATLPIVLVHLATALIYGYCLNRRSWSWALSGLALGSAFHLAYNFQAILGNPLPPAVLIGVAAMALAASGLFLAGNNGLRDETA